MCPRHQLKTLYISIPQCSKLLSIKSTGGRTLQLQDRSCSCLRPNRRQLSIRKWQRSLRWRQPKGESRPTWKRELGNGNVDDFTVSLSASFQNGFKEDISNKKVLMKAADFRESQWIPVDVWALWTFLVTHWSLKIAQRSQKHRLWSTEPGWTLLSWFCVLMPFTRTDKKALTGTNLVFHYLNEFTPNSTLIKLHFVFHRMTPNLHIHTHN